MFTREGLGHVEWNIQDTHHISLINLHKVVFNVVDNGFSSSSLYEFEIVKTRYSKCGN